MPECDIAFFTTDKPIDEQILGPSEHARVPQHILPWNGRPWKWPAFFKAYRGSVKKARQLFEQRKPAAVLGLGGYASAPAMVAAKKAGVPTAVFNPDAVPGRANRRLIRRADMVFVQWDVTWERLGRSDQVRITGCPVRPEFASLSRDEGCKACGVDPSKHVLLIFGASQGATNINAAALALAELFHGMTDWQILHITGQADCAMVRKEYSTKLPTAKVFDFTPKLAWAMAAADLVICRAGASTLAELTTMGRAAVLMPYPYDRKKHQFDNARVLADAGAAVIVRDAIDPVANARALKPVLKDLMTSHERRRRIARAAKAIGRPDAADAIAEGLLQLINADND